ncbi:MAG TPA: nuclease A inhibitor family protein [Planctomycetota bacterium]|nr:nuclease A inhibitor family protein [Planctomycetota bacterium]
MSGGVGGAGRHQAIDAFEHAVDAAAQPGTASGEKVTKPELKKALAELKPAGNLDAKGRAAVWETLAQHSMTAGAKALAEQAVAPSGTGVAHGLADLAKDLLFSSESDYPYKPFAHAFDKSKPLTPDNFRAALGMKAGTPVRFESAAEWFKNNQDPDQVPDADIPKYKALEAAMKANLKDIHVIYTGTDDTVQAPVFFVGRLPDGSLSGLQSIRIWT